MRVMCIDDSPGKEFAPEFKYGDILNASPCPNEIPEPFKSRCYLIEEFPKYRGQWSLWSKNRFIPLSDVDILEELIIFQDHLA